AHPARARAHPASMRSRNDGKPTKPGTDFRFEALASTQLLRAAVVLDEGEQLLGAVIVDLEQLTDAGAGVVVELGQQLVDLVDQALLEAQAQAIEVAVFGFDPEPALEVIEAAIARVDV